MFSIKKNDSEKYWNDKLNGNRVSNDTSILQLREHNISIIVFKTWQLNIKLRFNKSNINMQIKIEHKQIMNIIKWIQL